MHLSLSKSTYCILLASCISHAWICAVCPQLPFSAFGLEYICVRAEFGIAPTTPGRGSQLSPPFKLVAPNSDMKEIPATFVVSTSIKMQKVLLLYIAEKVQTPFKSICCTQRPDYDIYDFQSILQAG